MTDCPLKLFAAACFETNQF